MRSRGLGDWLAMFASMVTNLLSGPLRRGGSVPSGPGGSAARYQLCYAYSRAVSHARSDTSVRSSA